MMQPGGQAQPGMMAPGQMPMGMPPGVDQQQQPGMAMGVAGPPVLVNPHMQAQQPKRKKAYDKNDWPMETTKVTCHKCGQEGYTEVEVKPSMLAWILCIVIAFLGCWCGCCLIPFCVPACNDIKHKCTKCNEKLGYYRPM